MGICGTPEGSCGKLEKSRAKPTDTPRRVSLSVGDPRTEASAASLPLRA